MTPALQQSTFSLYLRRASLSALANLSLIHAFDDLRTDSCNLQGEWSKALWQH